MLNIEQPKHDLFLGKYEALAIVKWRTIEKKKKEFSHIVKCVSLHVVEIWGCKNNLCRESLRKDKKWTPISDRNTPENILIKEEKISMMDYETWRRAIKYEDKLKTIDDDIKNEIWKQTHTQNILWTMNKEQTVLCEFDRWNRSMLKNKRVLVKFISKVI